MAKIEGLKELNAQLKQLDSMSKQKRVARNALKSASQPIIEDAKSRAPHLTGALESSGTVGTKLTKRQARLQRKINDPSAVRMYIGFGPLAHLQEFGTVDQAPQPFLQPAWESGKDKLVDDIKVELGKGILKSLTRQNKLKSKGR